MRGIAPVILIAAAFLAAVVTGAALAAADPYRLAGGVPGARTCYQTHCVRLWWRYDSTPPGRPTVATTVHYRWVFNFKRPVSVRQRQTYAGNVRASIVAEARKRGRRVSQPLRMRWADRWRVLIADISYVNE